MKILSRRRRRSTKRLPPPPFLALEKSLDGLKGVERLVVSITQSPLGSTTAVESPCWSPGLVKVARVKNNVNAAVKLKQKVAGFKLDDTTVYAWFHDDSELFPSASASLLMRKAQNNFQTSIQPSSNAKSRQLQESKSLRIAKKLQTNNPQSLGQSKGPLPPASRLACLCPSTRTI